MTYFIHADYLGTERARSNMIGPVEACTSLPYGDALTCTGSDPSPMHFTVKQRDPESGLDDFPARYYSSIQGRWMNPDWSVTPNPVPYAKLGDPQSLNLYAYVDNDPTNHPDPDGHILSATPGTAGAPQCNADTTEGCTKQPQNNQIPLGGAPPAPGVPSQGYQKTEYPTAVAAGAAEVKDINPQSIKQGAEYGGNIYKNPDGTYSTQAPNKGGPDSVQLPSVDTLPSGTTRAGWYHTHGNGEGQLQGGEIFSDQDKGIAGAKASYDHNPHEPAVLGTPSEAIKVYDPGTGRTITLPGGTN